MCWCNSLSPRDGNQCVQPRPVISCYRASFEEFSRSDFFISSLPGNTVWWLTVSKTLQDCADSIAGCLPFFPSWLFLFLFFLNLPVLDYIYSRNAYACFCWTVIGCVLRVQVFHGQYEFKEFLASPSHPRAAGRYLPFQLFVSLCWKPGQGSDPGMFHSVICFCSIECQRFVKDKA